MVVDQEGVGVPGEKITPKTHGTTTPTVHTSRSTGVSTEVSSKDTAGTTSTRITNVDNSRKETGAVR